VSNTVYVSRTVSELFGVKYINGVILKSGVGIVQRSLHMTSFDKSYWFVVRARARQMECRKKPVLSMLTAGFRHAFDLLATGFSTRFAAGYNNGMERIPT